MPFPFWWVGAAVAAIVLGTAFTLFALATRVLARAADEIRDSVLPGLVSGWRDWTRYPAPRPAVSSAGAVSPGWHAAVTTSAEPADLEEVPNARSTPTEPVLRR